MLSHRWKKAGYDDVVKLPIQISDGVALVLILLWVHSGVM